MIPKLVHLIWVQGEDHMKKHYPEGVRSMNQWKRLHPNYDIQLWSKEKFMPVIRKQYPELHTLILTAKPPMPFAYEADVARMAILREHGGIYCDVDSLPLRNVEHVLYKANFVITNINLSRGERLLMDEKRSFIANHFIASSKGHPLWDTCENIIKNNKSKWSGPKWPKSTNTIVESPFLDILMDAVDKHKHSSDFRMLTSEQTYPSFVSYATKKLIRQNLNDEEKLRKMLPSSLFVEQRLTGQDWRKTSGITAVKNMYEMLHDYWIIVVIVLLGLVILLCLLVIILFRRNRKNV